MPSATYWTGKGATAAAFLWLLAGISVAPWHVVRGTSRQRLHNFLNHPHYSDVSHQHAHETGQSGREDHHWTPLSKTTPYTADPPDLRSTRLRTYRNVERGLYGTAAGLAHLKKTYGPTGLPEVRRAYGISQELENVRQANEHFLLMRNQSRCRTPRPKLVRVTDHYQDSSKLYLPRCTILHRCDGDSGCCDNDDFECAPRVMQEVSLLFYTLHTTRPDIPVGFGNSVERLLFVNHTECECQPVANIPQETPTHNVQSDTRSDASELVGHSDSHPNKDGNSKCRDCPHPFTRREYPYSRCGCDCFDRQKPCLRIKRGREQLTEVERRCVEVGRCHIPECEFGVYDVTSGRCPKRPDDYHRRSGHRQTNSESHRWLFLERD